MADVAAHPDVAPRTVYVRFANKAALLQRCLDVAIGGDQQRVAVPDRDRFHAAMTAPTAAERIARMAAISARLCRTARMSAGSPTPVPCSGKPRSTCFSTRRRVGTSPPMRPGSSPPGHGFCGRPPRPGDGLAVGGHTS
ncbi:TetR/AcrR family transcriptional regulator [Actinokineospora sp.]|uniref:TetR/AcrR family transcriptional regulator n=1 Tax=Actinokineospora sp. TaxID=1872133 RepID=UPI003D6A052C